MSIYAVLIWLLFFQFKILPWNRVSKILVSLIGFVIVLVVVGLLNTNTPSGRVTAVAKVNEIAPVVGGVVKSVPVTANVPLPEGTVLFEIDPTPYQYSLDQAQASLNIAELTLTRIQTVLERGSSSVSEQSRDEAQATYDEAAAAYGRAKYDLDQTVIRAPSDGVVSALGVSVGDQARPLNPVMPYIRTDTIFLAAVFSQNGLPALKPGTKVKFVLDRNPGRIFTSEIVDIAAGTASGQIPIGSSLLGAADIGSASEALIVLAWPDDLGKEIAIVGSVGSATAFASDAGAIGILAEVLFYFKMLATYL
ncbi:MAG: biotin/lipoyl-binding protein [Hyphomicrobiales bacterium]